MTRIYVCMLLFLCLSGAVFAEMLDDFDGNGIVSGWWGSDSIAPFCYTLDFTSTQHVHSGAHALRVDYDKANDSGSPYSFFSASGGYNLRIFDYLSFWVYNDGSPLWIKIRFEESPEKAWETDWAGIFPMTQTTNADWENLVVDLSRTFSATNVDWTAVKQIIFMVQPGTNIGTGTFWMDDVCLQRGPGSAPLDPFESDFYGWAAGGPFAVLRVTNEFHNAGTAAGLGQFSLRVSWTAKANGDYSNFTYDPRHDTNSAPVGRIGNYPNFKLRTNNTLDVWVKSTTDNNMPILVKLDDADLATLNYTGAGAWQKLSFGYAGIVGATEVGQVLFMPYPGAADNGGTLYLDDVNLTGGSVPPVPLAPTGLAATAFAGGGYTVSWSRATAGYRYQLQESRDPNFGTVSSVFTTNLTVSFHKDRATESGAFFYRVRSSVEDGVTEIFGNFSKWIRVDVPPDPVRRWEVVESFDTDGLVAAWWGSDPTEPYCYQQDFTSTQHVHSGTYALQIDYNKANDTNSVYSFLAASGLYNLENFDYLSFWVYNDGAPLHIKVRFEDAAGEPWEADWAAIFPATITPEADWENMVVDLTRTFSATNVNWKQIRHIMFMVEAGVTNATGRFWLDDIELHRSVNSAPLETFESDFYGWAAGDLFTVGLDSNVFLNDGTGAGIGHKSLRMAWSNKTPDYSNITYEPAHDSLSPTGRIGNYADFTVDGNHSIELYVRSPTETNMPILLKLDDADAGYRTYTGTGEWQRLIWGFSGMGGATRVGKVFVIPYPNQGDDGGTLYMDDMNITGGAGPAIPYGPQGLATTADAIEEDGRYAVTWGTVAGVGGYQLQEDTDREFRSPTTYPAVDTNRFEFSKNPKMEQGLYFYRVRSLVVSGTVTNYGSFSKPIGPVKVIPGPVDKGEVVEDFDGHSLVSAWWGSDPQEPWAYLTDPANTEQVHSGSNALKVVFDKANDPGNAYVFFSASGNYNLANYDFLSFWVYNDGSPLRIKVRIEQTWERAWESDWAGIFPSTATPAADWENLVVDLTRAFGATNVDWTAVKQIMFMVEPGSTNAAGTFWLDDIRLWRAPNSAPLEPFESDFYGWAAGAPFSLELATNICHNDGTLTGGLGQRSLRVAWGPKDADYGNFTYETLHDTNSAPAGRIGNYGNLSLNGNRVLQLWVRSDTETNMPILIKCDSVIDDMGVRTYTGTGEWQKLSWDISAFSGIDNVHQVFLFPYPGAADDGGEFFFDDLNLVGGMAPMFPTTPGGLGTTAADPDHDGRYNITWSPVEDATIYEVRESSDPNFTSYTIVRTTNTWLEFAKDPDAQAGAYYYTVRAITVAGGVTNVSGLPANPVRVRLALPPAAKNQSYETACAEVDNLNVPLSYPGAPGYRITVTHPKYYPTTIGERGADFDDCDFTETTIWRIGTNDGFWGEFLDPAPGGSHEFYAQDNPAAGIDQSASNFPKEINGDWMTNETIRFTAEEVGDVNLEQKIGATLMVNMAMVGGSLAVRMEALASNGWVDCGTRVFDGNQRTNWWTTPDLIWREGVDVNAIRLSSVRSQSSPGAWAIYDSLELSKRSQRNETVYSQIYDDGNVVVDAVAIDFWWRAPQSMNVHVIGPNSSTNVYDVQYFRITKRIPDTNSVEYSQVFVLYEDGNARIEPHPPRGIDWVPFGASVILGPSEDGVRPFVGIKDVTLYAKDLSMDVLYDDGGGSHVEMWVDREQNVVDVTPLYDTVVKSLCRFRSMWVYDGKADIDRVETGEGVLPVSELWGQLGGPWWKFYKAAPTFHNTYCPEFLIEARGIDEAFLTRQAESLDAGTNYVVVNRGHGAGGQAINMSVEGGEAKYNIILGEDRLDTTMIVRYADDDGGNNGDYPGNLIQVYVDGELKGQTHSSNTGGWDEFEDTPAILLGDLTAGAHEIKIVTGPLSFGVDLDQFELISRPSAVSVRQDLLTRQAESFETASGIAISNRSNAAGGQTIAITGQVARFNGPRGVAIDSDEKAYVADTSNHTIRRISTVGVASTIAGAAGQAGSADGTGIVARFNSPRGVALDRNYPRNVLVADTGNHTIRRIAPDGTVTTLVGLAGSYGNADGTGTTARFNGPAAVAADRAGNIYVADMGNHTIRKISPAGVVSTLAGSAGLPGGNDGVGTNARFNSPSGIAADDNWVANVYVADTGNHTIRKIAPDGTVTTVAGLAGASGADDGTGTGARFNGPCGISCGLWWPFNLYVADTGNHTIRKVTTDGAVTTLAGVAGSAGETNGIGSAARFEFPDAVAVNEPGNLMYVVESSNHTVRTVASPNRPNYIGLLPGVVTSLAGEAGVSGSDDVATNAQATYSFTVAAARTNAYLAVRYADPAGPNRIEILLDGHMKGRFPTENTPDWNHFTTCAPLYLGTLTAGTHTVTLRPNAGTRGVELDQFEIFSCTSAVRAASGRFRFSQDSYNVFEGEGMATVTVLRVGGSEGSVSVGYFTEDGTAAAGLDYLSATGVLVFANGETSKTFTISILEDALKEGQESATIQLVGPTGGASLAPQHTADLNISDPLRGWLQFSTGAVLAAEAGGAATVTVTRTGGSQGRVGVTYRTSDGTAATGLDYTATTGVLVFASGETERTFTVPVLNDGYHERDETIYLMLSDPTDGAQLGRQDTAVMTILDDEMILPLVIGENNASAAEFAQADYTNWFYAATMRAGQFPKELTLGTWATQYIVAVADDFDISCGLILTLDATTNNGSGALTVRVDVDNGTCYQYAGTTEVSWSSNGYVAIAPILLAAGANTIRLTAESGSGGTTSVLWDQIMLSPRFYVQHLAYDNYTGTDLFPQATAEQTNYSGAACCWMVARYLKGTSFTLTQQQIFNANTKDPAHGNEITPASCANWMTDIGWPPYWFSEHQVGTLNEALRESVYWMDYTPTGGIQSPVFIVCGTNWQYKLLRGFETDKKPYDGNGPVGSTYAVHGLWLNDPAFGGLGYNVYVVAEEMSAIYTPSSADGKYKLVVEPPPTAAELENARRQIAGSTLTIAPAEGDADMAASLQTLLGRRTTKTRAPASGPARAVGTRDPSLIKVIPYALVQDPGFMAAFQGSDANATYTVNAQDPANAYVLTAGGVRGPASTVYVLKLDPESGALRQATWQDKPAFYPPLSQEAAAWLGRPASYPYAVLAGAELVYDPKIDRSPFFPRWKLRYSAGGQIVTSFVAQAEAAGLGGDSDLDGMSDLMELYAGCNPTNARSAFWVDSRMSLLAGSQYGVIQWSSVSNRMYSIRCATSVTGGFATVESHIAAVPPMNSYTTLLPAASSYYRVSVE